MGFNARLTSALWNPGDPRLLLDRHKHSDPPGHSTNNSSVSNGAGAPQERAWPCRVALVPQGEEEALGRTGSWESEVKQKEVGCFGGLLRELSRVFVPVDAHQFELLWQLRSPDPQEDLETPVHLNDVCESMIEGISERGSIPVTFSCERPKLI